eukprot:14519019-Alexandrium_andersonii.AAC.1
MEEVVLQPQTQLGEVTAELTRLRAAAANGWPRGASAAAAATAAVAGVAARARAEDLTKLGKPKTFSPSDDFEEWDF